MRVGFSVGDTGVGMDPDVAARVFEPFFTTKGAGHRVGLGLSTVYGIVKQSGGDIAIDTEPGRGTCITISFPALSASDAVVGDTPRRIAGGNDEKGRILLVEDELAVRRAAIRILTRRGYEVIEACSGPDALKQLDAHGGSISLLLTDVVMPGMNGRELADIVAARHPEAGVLFMSGYTDDEILRRGLLGREVAFLTKPFSPEALVEAVAERMAAQVGTTVAG
jgi:CheY-like chemotaxis protein